jgi:hypothetical protein
MKKKERILKAITENREIQKGINKLTYFDDLAFYENAERYIKAIKENRIICNIESVSKSGMSRNIKFLECSINKDTKRANWLNFYAFFTSMNFERVKNSNSFRIHGCGMDMIFDTNYRIIHKLGNLGFLTKEEVRILAQNTPPII